MILTQINGRYFLELSEEQVARAAALCAAMSRFIGNLDQECGQPPRSVTVVDVLHGALIRPGLIQLEANWMRQLRELESGTNPASSSPKGAILEYTLSDDLARVRAYHQRGRRGEEGTTHV